MVLIVGPQVYQAVSLCKEGVVLESEPPGGVWAQLSQQLGCGAGMGNLARKGSGEGGSRENIHLAVHEEQHFTGDKIII